MIMQIKPVHGSRFSHLVVFLYLYGLVLVINLNFRFRLIKQSIQLNGLYVCTNIWNYMMTICVHVFN